MAETNSSQELTARLAKIEMLVEQNGRRLDIYGQTTARIHEDLHRVEKTLRSVAELLERAAPLLESRMARAYLNGPATVLDALKKGGARRG